MQNVPQEFVDDLNNLFIKHNIDKLDKADMLGQAMVLIPKACAGFDIEHINGGFAYALAIKNDVVNVLKELVNVLEKRDQNHLNYNDMDCNLIGKHIVIHQPCLECDSFVSKLNKNNPAPQTKDCTRCNGTAIDPEYKYDLWVIDFDNHGYHTVYIVLETCSGYELHIRRLQGEFNYLSDDEAKEAISEICEAMKKGRFDSNSKWIRNRDSRDEGFVISLTYEKFNEHYHSIGLSASHDCQTTFTGRAIHDIEIISEHFSWVIKDLKSGVL